MRIRTITITLAAAIALGATGCASSTPPKAAADPAPAASSAAPAAPAASAVPAAPADAVTPASGAPTAPKDAVNLPPAPDAATTAKYIAALLAIDPEIVSGKEDKAVNRGRDECSSIAQWPKDREKLVDLANKRFISPNHPDGFGPAKSAKILDVVHTYICPKL